MRAIIVIPAYNEGKILESSILKIVNFCQNNLKIDWQIVITDNKSTDQTSVIGKALAQKEPQVEYLYTGYQGKGAAIKAGWQKYLADIYCFMDADLATDLSALPKLIEGIKEGYDIVVGSRFHQDSQCRRSLSRKLISQGYRLLLKLILGVKINDAPCGFKAINDRVKKTILPQVKNQEWFFDSELVILAEKQGYKIKEIPVIWQDPREGKDKSRVKTISLSWAYFKQILALRKRLTS